MSLETITNAWRTFKKAMKRLLDDYLYYYSHGGRLFLDPISEDQFIYQHLLEEEEAES